MLKITFREIKKSFGRYIAILAIVALGVGFFCGLRLTKTAMIHTLDEYADDQHLFDERLVCSLGYTDDELSYITQADGIRAAEGMYSLDALCDTPSSSNTVFHFMSIPSQINIPLLKSGRMPESNDECLADAWMFDESIIGSQITLNSENDTATTDNLTTTTFTVVGLANSPIYINYERGNTSIGSGSISAFIYLLPSAFSMDYYTEIDILLDATVGCSVYTDDYDSAIDDSSDWITDIAETASDSRYQSIRSDAKSTLDDAKATLEEKQEELFDAQEKLADAEKKLKDGEAALQESSQKISSGWNEYYQGTEELSQQEESTYAQLQDARTQLDNAQAEIDTQRSQILAQKEQLTLALSTLSPSDSQYTLLSQQLLTVNEGISQLTVAQATLDGKMEEWQASKDAADTGFSAAQEKLDSAKVQLETAERELSAGNAELNSSKKKIAEAKTELAEGTQKLENAQKEYEDGLTKYNDLEMPNTYVLGRDTNVGYVCFESDSNIVAGVSVVFPLFFFAVAALVCITTMTRMVDEQRTQIGTLKALGYSDSKIISIYFIYAGSASVLGCVLGISVGSYLFPKMIWMGYNIMYGFTNILFAFDWSLALISSGAFLVCALLATWYAIYSDLRLSAAELIRPKSPKSGKRTILEHVPFIWNHLSFLKKVSIRNILRYKKRMVMMAIGIGGCTALLLTGFGLNDSIENVVEYQYDEITLYNGSITFTESLDKEQRQTFESAYHDEIDSINYISQSSMDISFNNMTKSINVMVTDNDSVEGFMNLALNDNNLTYPKDNECYISTGAADQMNIHVGDIITVRNSNMDSMTLTVSGIFTNYVYNYIFITQNTYETQMNEEPEFKTAWVFLNDNKDEHEISAKISESSQVASVSLGSDLRVRVNKMMSGMNYIVAVVIASAGALAFIVLYNLTNINITERAREIATVKVLGFNDHETNWYIFRENLTLTVLGIIVGVPMGIALHAFVMSKIKIDMISFDVRISTLSFILSVLLTFVFALVVNAVLSIKIRKIDMASALKSIE